MKSYAQQVGADALAVLFGFGSIAVWWALAYGMGWLYSHGFGAMFILFAWGCLFGAAVSALVTIVHIVMLALVVVRVVR